jgi:type II secretory pathway pseudopilin PulG
MKGMVLGIAAFAALFVLSANVAEALDRRVRVVNNTSQTMVKLQASNVGSNSWEEDILGDRVLGSGREIVVNLNDGTGYCVFDLRATFRSGATAVRRRVNICRVGVWTIND